MSLTLPALFLERLQKIVAAENYQSVLNSFSFPGELSVRINTLKIVPDRAMAQLKLAGIPFRQVEWCREALVIDQMAVKDFGEFELVKSGCLYRQGLSSLLPVLVLGPQPGESVLDFCAAPGSKTTQIAAMMNNEGNIVAVEAVRPRFYRLKAVCQLLGANAVVCKLTDARRFRCFELFDRVLVDAPCSSEGRFKTDDPLSAGYWSLRKIKEMVHKQRGLLLSASRFVKPGGILVYSTCTFAPEENEGVVDWFLRKSKGTVRLLPAAVDGVLFYPAVKEWEGRVYSSNVENTLRVLPDGVMEGFFVAKFVKT